MTSDRGLCGGFNSNICRLAKKYFEKILKEGKNLKIITVGQKVMINLRENMKYIIKNLALKIKKKFHLMKLMKLEK